MNKEFAAIPEVFQSARKAIEPLVKMTNALGALPDINAQARELTNQLAAIAGAGKQQEEALEATSNKLHLLAGVAGGGWEGLEGLNSAIGEIAEINETAAKYASGIKETEKEIQRINTGLKHVESTMRVDGLQLAGVLKDAILAFDEAKAGEDDTKSLIDRLFRN